MVIDGISGDMIVLVLGKRHGGIVAWHQLFWANQSSHLSINQSAGIDQGLIRSSLSFISSSQLVNLSILSHNRNFVPGKYSASCVVFNFKVLTPYFVRCNHSNVGVIISISVFSFTLVTLVTVVTLM